MGNLITLLIFGLLIGGVSYFIMPHKSIKNMALYGIAGTEIGGVLSNLILQGYLSFNIVSIFIFCALAFIFLSRRALQAF